MESRGAAKRRGGEAARGGAGERGRSPPPHSAGGPARADARIVSADADAGGRCRLATRRPPRRPTRPAEGSWPDDEAASARRRAASRRYRGPATRASRCRPAGGAWVGRPATHSDVGKFVSAAPKRPPDSAGDVSIITPMRLFCDLALAGETGLLHFELGDTEKEIFLVGGAPESVSSSNAERALRRVPGRQAACSGRRTWTSRSACCPTTTASSATRWWRSGCCVRSTCSGCCPSRSATASSTCSRGPRGRSPSTAASPTARRTSRSASTRSRSWAPAWSTCPTSCSQQRFDPLLDYRPVATRRGPRRAGGVPHRPDAARGARAARRRAHAARLDGPVRRPRGAADVPALALPARRDRPGRARLISRLIASHLVADHDPADGHNDGDHHEEDPDQRRQRNARGLRRRDGAIDAVRACPGPRPRSAALPVAVNVAPSGRRPRPPASAVERWPAPRADSGSPDRPRASRPGNDRARSQMPRRSRSGSRARVPARAPPWRPARQGRRRGAARARRSGASARSAASRRRSRP